MCIRDRLRPEQLLLLPATAREGLPAELVETSYYGHDAMARVAVAGVVVPVRLTGSIPVSYTHLDVYKRQAST